MSLREEFEAAYLKGIAERTSLSSDAAWIERGSDGEYRSFRAQGAWWAWQASREALEIELPRVCASDDPFDLKRDIAYELELAGVRVKP